LTRIEKRQFLKRFIQEQDLTVGIASGDPIAERYAKSGARPLRGVTLACMIHQDAPHYLRCHTKELRTIPPGDPILASESEIGLMHQRGRLEGVIRSLASQAPGGAPS